MSAKPAITAPLSRHLIVADASRSVAFYRDALGFEARDVAGEYRTPAVAEVVYGPARIQIGTPNGEGEASRSILFFATDDVDAMHAAAAARGARPSAVERVNWIKMRMFEVRDPDGHTLWFGQSFQEPDSPAPPPLLRQIMPEMPLTDVSAGVAHYRDVLGFRINYAQDDIGVMDRDRVRILLIARTERHVGIGSCCVYVKDADALHAELRSKGANVLDEPISLPWGLRQFHVVDLEGNQITFAQTFE